MTPANRRRGRAKMRLELDVSEIREDIGELGFCVLVLVALDDLYEFYPTSLEGYFLCHLLAMLFDELVNLPATLWMAFVDRFQLALGAFASSNHFTKRGDALP